MNLICKVFGHSYINTETQHIMCCSRCGKELHLKIVSDVIIHQYPCGKVIVNKTGEDKI